MNRFNVSTMGFLATQTGGVVGGFTMEVNIPSDSYTFTIPHVDYSFDAGRYMVYNYVVDYGDTNVKSVTTYNDANCSNTYATAGTYQIKISGTCENISFDNNTNCLDVTEIISWGNISLVDGYHMFYGCENIRSIPNDTYGGFTNLVSCRLMFCRCIGLTSIPSGLFDNGSSISVFNECFSQCRFTSIPSGLFDNCTSAIYMNACFSSCYPLSAIPTGLFDNCTSASDFTGTFSNTAITEIPTGLFSNCASATSFSGCFQDAQVITSIPSGLFDNCTLVTNFSNTFYACRSLLTIPTGLFNNCTSANDFRYCFSNCNQLSGDAPDLWNTFPSAFGNACFELPNQLTNYASIPAGWK